MGVAGYPRLSDTVADPVPQFYFTSSYAQLQVRRCLIHVMHFSQIQQSSKEYIGINSQSLTNESLFAAVTTHLK